MFGGTFQNCNAVISGLQKFTLIMKYAITFLKPSFKGFVSDQTAYIVYSFKIWDIS